MAHAVNTRLPHRVYFVEGAGLIKIGTTTDLEHRLRLLRDGCPIPLRLVHAVPGGMELEQAIHGHFDDWRHHGEWFSLPRDWRARLDYFLVSGPIASASSHWGRVTLVLADAGITLDLDTLAERLAWADALINQHGVRKARKLARARRMAVAFQEERT